MRQASRRNERVRLSRASLQVAVAITGLLSGCSGGSPSQLLPVSPLPPPPQPTNTAAYVGSQAPGYWDFTVDTTQNLFSYQALSGGVPAQSGAFTVTSGVLSLVNGQGVPIAKAVAQLGGGAMLRPGDPTAAPVAMVQQSDCFAINGNLRYIYAALPGQVPLTASQTNTGYGTFVVSTSSDGKTWNFGDLHNYVLTTFAGGPLAAGTENGRDPVTFSATCASSHGQGTVSADPAAFPVDQTGVPVLPAFHFDSAGAFVEDRSTGVSWIGFAMPSAAIKASDVAAGTYRGFVNEAYVYSVPPGPPITVPADARPVAFAPMATGSSTMTGGAFPNDDLTQTPGSEYTITLGTQDSTLNGVFPNAQFTALDVNAYCAATAQNDPTVQVSFDANGNEICTALGVGVVSQVNGKYVLYFTSNDGTISNNPRAYVIQFALYQQ
jgi:hypothetical protein